MALGEFSWIHTYLKPIAHHQFSLGLSDDAAVFPVHTGEELVVSTDAAVAGVHFHAGISPELIVEKTFRAAIADLAAMAAKPFGYVATLCRPGEGVDEAWLASFVGALGRVQTVFGLGLLGGDTVSTPGPLMVNFTVFGTVPVGQAVKRSAAQAGDLIYTTGTIGDSFLGLACLEGKLVCDPVFRDYFMERHYKPSIHCTFAQQSRPFLRSCIDISDGLIADLGHIAEASHVTAMLHVDQVPLSSQACAVMGQLQDPLLSLLTGGEDYELIVTIGEKDRGGFEACARLAKVPVSCIGIIVAREERSVRLFQRGVEISAPRSGYVHF